MKRIFYALVMTTALSGCIPRYATIRPHYEVDVLNRDGKPLTNATLWLQTIRFPPTIQDPPEPFHADAEGHIKVEKRARWSPIVFWIHGTEQFEWSWCIEAPGYLTHGGGSEIINSPVILTKAVTTEHCRHGDEPEYLSPEHQ